MLLHIRGFGFASVWILDVPTVFGQINSVVFHRDALGLEQALLLQQTTEGEMGGQFPFGIDDLIAGIFLRIGVVVQNVSHRPG